MFLEAICVVGGINIMADLFPAQIEIGGSIYDYDLPELFKHIEFGPSMGWDGDNITTRKQLEEWVAQHDKHVLWLADTKAYYGAFDTFEEWLISKELPFRCQNSAKYEYDSMVVWYNPDWKGGIPQCYHTPQDSWTIFVSSEVIGDKLSMLDNLLHHESEYPEKDIDALFDELFDELGPQYSGEDLLPPFEIINTCV